MKRTKVINRSRIMREIWIKRETSRVEIARSLGLDKSTISHTVNDLLEKGVIVETSEGNSGPQGGRKPVHIKLNKSFGSVLGVEFCPDSYHAVAVDMEGEIIYSHFEKIQLSITSFSGKLISILQFLQAELDRMNINLLGIGIGISGVVNAQEGVVKFSEPLGITSDYNFQEKVASHFEIPVFIENDANACVWGELAFHRRKELRDFIFLLLEFRDRKPDEDPFCNRIGVGMGFVINGNVHYGHHSTAGEFRSLFRNKDSVGQFSLSGAENQQVEVDTEILEQFLRELGAHVALLVNTFDLSHIILGGCFEELPLAAETIFEEEIKTNWPYPYEDEKHIWYSSFGNQAVAYGAAGLVLNTLFSDLEVMEGAGWMRDVRSTLAVF